MKPILFYARHGKLKGIYGLMQFKQLYLIIGLFYFTFPYSMGFDRPNIMYYLYSFGILLALIMQLSINHMQKTTMEAQWGARLMPYAHLLGTELTLFHLLPIRCTPVETVNLETVQHICIKCPLLGSMKYGIDIQYQDGSVRSYEAALDVPFNLEVKDLEAALKQHGVAFTFMRKYFFTKTQLPLKQK